MVHVLFPAETTPGLTKQSLQRDFGINALLFDLDSEAKELGDRFVAIFVL